MYGLKEPEDVIPKIMDYVAPEGLGRRKGELAPYSVWDGVAGEANGSSS